MSTLQKVFWGPSEFVIQPIWLILVLLGVIVAIPVVFLLVGAGIASALIAHTIMSMVEPEHFLTVAQWVNETNPVLNNSVTPDFVRLWTSIVLGLALFGFLGVRSLFRGFGAGLIGYLSVQQKSSLG